jgi:hypothetical protein
MPILIFLVNIVCSTVIARGPKTGNPWNFPWPGTAGALKPTA